MIDIFMVNSSTQEIYYFPVWNATVVTNRDFVTPLMWRMYGPQMTGVSMFSFPRPTPSPPPAAASTYYTTTDYITAHPSTTKMSQNGESGGGAPGSMVETIGIIVRIVVFFVAAIGLVVFIL